MHFLYSIVIHLYVSCSGTITSVGEERAYFTYNYVVSVISACDKLRYFLWYSFGLPYSILFSFSI